MEHILFDFEPSFCRIKVSNPCTILAIYYLNYNNIETLKGLDNFTRLQELILDNNKLEDNIRFPFMPNLRTLSLNNNKLTDLEGLIQKINENMPKLSYLSILRNKACPNQLSDSDKDDSDYQRYRWRDVDALLWVLNADNEAWHAWPGMPYVWFAAHWLAMSHTCYNPIIYCYMNSKYRHGFKQVLDNLMCIKLNSTNRSCQRSSMCEGIPMSGEKCFVYSSNGRKFKALRTQGNVKLRTHGAITYRAHRATALPSATPAN
ncbi:Leucine-rich repeat-containing protein C10orf11-like [Papilio xuthus]|uniref:Leucine-rich repeat-containing protein C10orf11-like n=1 Tax=Papilio xuthus TaxID=66420 RepID=A0A194QBP7_PAPXU|nr:Leucine-rich repeat-containing protein C10orf11-like [Papilio xuthus]